MVTALLRAHPPPRDRGASAPNGPKGRPKLGYLKGRRGYTRGRPQRLAGPWVPVPDEGGTGGGGAA
eukprot:CAMPEP_0204562666 /NCGR_PEP_ID=MMETSP0661-20131031/33876_1 /ASSEMBLY_ACC=CAM_ASM_000606 /TAXON_ID=109239 /ORGANISM="Alexandrium margalefi, Strain AMGDE01CS-322" /LENGTH=65 /DNA_ID=CAMNT_0051570161 /DNA_START=24 /DNA_END=217 /DNA_ORIENTATION=+